MKKEELNIENAISNYEKKKSSNENQQQSDSKTYYFYYSKINSIIQAISGIFFTGISFIFLSTHGTFALIFTAAGLLFLILGIKKLIDKNSQISINHTGVKLKNTEWIQWNKIIDIDFYMKRSNKSRMVYMKIYTKNKDFKVNISELDTSQSELRKTIHLFRK